MRHGSLFSGIGGFDLAAQWMGWENVFHCEWNEFGQKVLKHYWPNAESFTDITKSDFTKYANTIDILTGGFPCQPFSVAGNQQGTEDDRFLWPEMLRAIKEIRPRWVIGENVSGFINMALDQVLTEVENEGYQTEAYHIPACGIGAPHQRYRVWIVAYRNNRQQNNANDKIQAGWNATINVCRNASNASHQGLQGGEVKGSIAGSGKDRDEQPAGFFRTNWQEFPTQSPLCNGNDGLSSRLDIDTISFSKWRNESIKAGGNAIVPQVAYELFKAIEQYENL
jgi:DNA (cytosine-5)-methyltransferase 1